GTMSTQPTILITGAGGFLGGWVAESLHLSGAASVRAGVHRWGSAVRVARFPIEITHCDVLQPETLDAAFRGVDMIVHCAVSPDVRVITEGTKNTLEAASRANVRKFLHISSVAVYGEATGAVSETTALRPTTDYGIAKAEAERHCRSYAQKGFPVVILRPSN